MVDIETENEVVACVSLMICVLNETEEKEKRVFKRKRLWVKDWLKKRERFSHTNLLNELKIRSPHDYTNFLRMDDETYQDLLEMVSLLISKQNTLMRNAISNTERLSTTLRFLATGQSFQDLKFLTAISPQSIGKIVIDTCEAIVKVLKNYIKIPENEAKWKKVASEFEEIWNFPQCVGALDGKHVNIKKPASSGSFYFNYKKTYSVVLMALVNASYEFMMVDVGTNGRVSDGGVFDNTLFHKKLESDELNLPPPEPHSSGVHVPYVFVGDDAFAMSENLMKPYAQRNLTIEQAIFNYRLSRACRIVENVFGILASRFRVLLTTINLDPRKTSIVVLACCYLHNFLRRKNGNSYVRGSVDVECLVTGTIEDASWRKENAQMSALQQSKSRNSSVIAKETREKVCTYFISVGAVPWQKHGR